VEQRKLSCSWRRDFARAAGCAWIIVQASAGAHAQAHKPVHSAYPDGAWEGPYDLPIVSNGEIVHATYLPPNITLPSSFEGQVMLVSNRYPNCEAPPDPHDHTRAWIWNPSIPDDVTGPIDVPNSQHSHLWCSGHALAPNGDLYAFGGTDMTQTCYTGSTGVHLWSGDTWSVAGALDPAGPRWYPSVLQLAVPGTQFLIIGHVSHPFGPELTHQVFDVSTGVMSALFSNRVVDAACQPTGEIVAVRQYPWAFWISSGTVFVAGPDADEKYVGCRQTDGSFNWIRAPASTCRRTDGNAVHVLNWMANQRRETIYVIGGMASLTGPGANSGDCDWNVLDTMESISNPSAAPTSTWSSQSAMRYSRRHAESLPLPDGTVLTVGGIGWDGPSNLSGHRAPRYQPECFDPIGNRWVQFAAQQHSRNYHSVAFLLLDGRVVSAGGIDAPHTLEIFSPPYLFRGPRPLIQSAPGSISWCTAQPPSCGVFTMHVTLGVATDSIAKVTLVRPASITHGVDPNQRFIELPIIRQSQPDAAGQPLAWDLDVQLPETVDVAPPGWYMLFAVSSRGIPTVGRFLALQ
jgi:galactose oxidase